ncbi:hypothetical protein CDD82_7470 [Ophiocordyceps australis]|uniref:26S proteasome regulatory subunit RPN2 n=1 Tax=Ophiocordyceps australis TaxID=1399860 RepID=A0A2C5YK27_9HYPO|nr:hypothetical protein CDD82_7470 [Ophiocordyceps australis]
MPGLVSATGVLAFLADEEAELKVFALQTLNDDIDTVWTEVADSLNQLEALYEDDSFPERQLVALVLAKVYYHLQAYNDSMVFALAAGDLFKLDAPGEFEETIISKCVDQYIASSASKHIKPNPASNSELPELTTTFSHASEGALMSPTTPFSHTTLPPKSLLSRASLDNTIIDATFQPVLKQGRSGSVAQLLPDQATEASLQRVIDRLFESALKQGRYRQVVGIAVEAKNLEVLRRVIKRASEDEKRAKSSYRIQDGPPGPAEELMEYMLGICMDIVQERSFRTEILRLILDLLSDIPHPDYFAIARCVVYLNADDEASRMLRSLVDKGERTLLASAYQIAFDLYDNGTQEFLGKVLASLPSGKQADKKESAEEAPQETQSLLANQQDDDGEKLPESEARVWRNIGSILDGSKTIRLNLEFLYRNNHTDLSILNKVRDSLEGRNSIFHTAVTFCNGFMNQGTTNDKFFRDNLEWLGKAVNWSKFSATAALGVIHRGNLSQSRKLLEPYLPKPGAVGTGSVFSQGGALYAYGLIHANHGADALDYLKTQFGQTKDDVVQHGGALGLGIAGMATGDGDLFENLKRVLFEDKALNGEAVGLSMGLIMLGTGNVKALEDMITYAHETTHEKIVRGVAIGMALIMYGRQEGADVLIEGLLNDPDPTLRYGGILTSATSMTTCGA